MIFTRLGITFAILLVLISAGCRTLDDLRTKANYVAHGVPAKCYDLSKESTVPDAENSDGAAWWAANLSREDFLVCYEAQQIADLTLQAQHAEYKERIGELGDAILEEAERSRRHTRCVWYGACGDD